MRELADAYRKGNCRVFGIVFSRFFDIPKGEPSSEDLDRNARLGCDFLLNRDLKSPFDVLAMVGPPINAPLSEPVSSDRGLPHSFPGLLSALSLVTDAGEDLSTRYEQARTNNPTRTVDMFGLDLAFGARGKGEQIHDTDVLVSDPRLTGTKGYVSLADARDAAEEAKQRLASWRTFPFEKAYGASSLFVERKLGRRAFPHVAQLSETGHVGREKSVATWRSLLGNTERSARPRGLESFERWIVDIVETRRCVEGRLAPAI